MTRNPAPLSYFKSLILFNYRIIQLSEPTFAPKRKPFKTRGSLKTVALGPWHYGPVVDMLCSGRF